MSLEAGLVSHLMADSDVTDVIGTRLYPLRVPQDVALPASAYQVISDSEEHSHDGPSGLVSARLQFTHHGATYEAAKEAAAAVRESIDGFSGTMGSTTVDGVESQRAWDSWVEGYSTPTVRQDFLVWYQR